MSHRRLFPATLAVAALAGAPSAGNEFAQPLAELAKGELKAFVTAPEILAAVRAQNSKHTNITQQDIDAMDQTWRSEVGTASGPMIEGVLAQPGSAWLRDQTDAMSGLITEVFVTDRLGLNVVQSNVTSDYWQGDEAKWTESFGTPDGTVHLGEVELDESTQTYQSQVSMPINDPETGEPLGAITVGINLEMLQ